MSQTDNPLPEDVNNLNVRTRELLCLGGGDTGRGDLEAHIREFWSHFSEFNNVTVGK